MKKPADDDPSLPVLKNNRMRIAGALFIAVTAAIAFPVIFGSATEFTDRQGGDPWRNAIYDFQTLITGVLAVVAAAATVVQLQVADRKSDERHRQSMELALRGDRLLLQRALVPQIEHMRDCGGAALRLYETFLEYSASTDDAGFPPLDEWWWEFHDIFVHIAETIERPHFKEGERLFDGDLIYRLWDLRRHTMIVMSEVDKAKMFCEAPLTYEEEANFSRWEDDGGPGRIADYVRYCAREFPGILDGLTRVGLEYGIHLPR